ncbi:MAG: metal-dependent hydrolase [Gammaproteobacteria bacterium]
MFGKPRARTPENLQLIPRVVRFDYESVMRKNRYWHGGDPVTTHFFNALQAMFPEGERFFMDSARDVRDMLGKDNISAELNEQIRLFIRQEAMHGREHDAWTTALISLGYIGMEGFDLKLKRDNKWSKKHLKPIWRLAMTAASEHFTASLAHLFIYKRPDFIEQAASPFRELLVYHAMEEVEHKAVCYDLYNEAKGGYFLRIAGMVFVTFDLLIRLRNRQEYLLKKDGQWTPENRKKARDLLWGKDGIMRVLAPYLLQYFRPDFHPWETDERRDLIAKYKLEMQVIDEQQAQPSAA